MRFSKFALLSLTLTFNSFGVVKAGDCIINGVTSPGVNTLTCTDNECGTGAEVTTIQNCDTVTCVGSGVCSGMTITNVAFLNCENEGCNGGTIVLNTVAGLTVVTCNGAQACNDSFFGYTDNTTPDANPLQYVYCTGGMNPSQGACRQGTRIFAGCLECPTNGCSGGCQARLNFADDDQSCENVASMTGCSVMPSMSPSITPGPTGASSPPSVQPSAEPSASLQPSAQPSAEPSASLQPSAGPSAEPSASLQPSAQPSAEPSGSLQPSAQPSAEPSASLQPSAQPSAEPSGSVQPSAQPSAEPSGSLQPSAQPSAEPSGSVQPSAQPSAEPSGSLQPSAQPSAEPSGSSKPSNMPSDPPSTTTTPSSMPSSPPSVFNWCREGINTNPYCPPGKVLMHHRIFFGWIGPCDEYCVAEEHVEWHQKKLWWYCGPCQTDSYPDFAN